MPFEKREQRKAADRDRQRNEILDVARREFAAKSYERVSMHEVADLSGYSVGHIYNVVGKKDALFEAVMMREAIQLAVGIDREISGCEDEPVRQRVDGLIDAVLEFFDSHREFFEIYLNETGGMRANIERRWTKPLCELKRETDVRVEELFARSSREGVLADLAPADMTIAFWELLNGFIASWAAGGYPGKISEKSDVIKHILWNGIQRRKACSNET
jgi:AcrR family transcriptional regulator